MILSSIWISGFKSFKSKSHEKNDVPFIVDDKITVLIGANDHGKTNILEAIQRLNDDSPILDVDKNWDLPEGEIPRIEWQFTLSPEEIEALKVDTPSTPLPEVAPATTPLGEGEVPPAVVIKPEELPQECFDLSGSANTVIFARSGIETPVVVASTPFKIEKKYEKYLLDLRPRVELFEISPDIKVVDQIQKEQLENKEDKNHEFIKGLFISADIWDMRTQLFGDTERSSKQIEIASQKLTKVMQEKWAQNDGSLWKLKQSGTSIDILNLRLQENAVKAVDVPPSRKSSGFRTFFLLSMMITARIYDSREKPHIFLFDEPGTYLHPRAQIDLQRSFEKRADEAQIVYTTHSLFLVSKNYPKRNRVISKTVEGTKVDQKPFVSNWKSVRDSLGIVMSNNFLIADKSILFEGPSDQFYVYNALRKMKEGGVDIDLNDFSTVDGGDSENYLAMAKVLLEEGRSILCIADGDSGGKTILNGVSKVHDNEAEKKAVYAKSHRDEVLMPDPTVNYLQLPAGMSTEDVFADKNLLLEAIGNVASNLVMMKVRNFVDKFNIATGIATIKNSKGKTLGAIIDDETPKWFTDQKRLSKLSVALEYDRLAQEKDYTIPEIAKKVILEIKTTLNLKGEKSVEQGVFEEV